tara:strand:- start:26399 stop:26635 length:237 start_codon:yes stop_codon:yes gene_type:complete
MNTSVHRGDWDWPESMPLDQAAERSRTPKRLADDEKMARIEAAIKRWETKPKRNETYLKKLRKQHRHLERKKNRPPTD